MMIAHACRKSAGTDTAWCGTKNDRIMNNPIAAVRNSGTSRFMRSPRASLGHHPLGEPVDAQGLEHAADDHDRDDDDLDEIGALEAPDELGLTREIRARRVQLLPHPRVVPGHAHGRKL